MSVRLPRHETEFLPGVIVKKLIVVAGALATVICVCVSAQSVSPEVAGNPSPPAAMTAVVATPPPAQANPQDATAADSTARIVTSIAEVQSSLSRIDAKLASAWWMTPATTLVSVVIGGLLSGVVAYRMQARLLKHQGVQAHERATLERELAEKKARHEVEQSKFELHVRQLTELYGPLRSLFDGSNEIYRRMNEILILHDPERFRDLTRIAGATPPEQVDPDGRYFEIRDESTKKWRKFRTIVDWNEVYGKGVGVDGYFDRIVDIGNRVSALIGEKAGLVMPHHGQLLRAFGKYLAHFQVLKELHTQSTSMPPSHSGAVVPMKIREEAAFPNEIQKLVKAGSEELLLELGRFAQP